MNDKSRYVVDQATAKLHGLMREAVWRANGHQPPTAEEMRAWSVVEEDTDTGRLFVRWRGALVLVVSLAHDGFKYEFMGPAAITVPTIAAR